MADKDLLEIIADMLRKLDQHSQELKEQGKALEKQGGILELHSEALRKQNEALTIFMDGTLKQFDQQQLVNEKFLQRLESLENRMN